MKSRSRAIVILGILVAYVLLQFIWWEILLVRQTGTIIDQKEKLAALTIAGHDQLVRELKDLQARKRTQIVMIVGEGTVFLLLLLYGIHRIKQARDREMELTGQENNFFLSVTHELKTPIAAMKLQLQTLQKQQLSDDIRRQLLRDALSENERLNGLIDNILLASRLGSGGMRLRKEKADLGGITQQVVQRYYQQHLREGRIALTTAQLTASVDEQAYTSIVTNLVDNALKYGASRVEVEIRQRGGKTLLSVSDNGPGIDDSEKQKVFRRFYRAGAEETRVSKGTGLGLYIVNTLAKAHGAAVKLRDNKPSGCIFEIGFNAA